MKKILFIFGTRPEAIKLAPLIKEFQKYPNAFETVACVTAQHREMLDQVLSFFEITPEYDLDMMKTDQNLFGVTAAAIQGLENVFNRCAADFVFVQGDTTTALAGALAGFYKQARVAHVEAGLRSGNKYSPYPEEMNRILTGHIADYHFAPTEKAKQNLHGEGISKNIWVVGNTVIDALFLGLEMIQRRGEGIYKEFFKILDLNKKIILVTGHRRESFGKPFENICEAIRAIAKKFGEVEIVYPVHMNPNVTKPVQEILSGKKNVHLMAPLEYPYLIWLMKQSYLVLTDSGGIQEEAPSLGKPVLVMRDVTERTEGIDAGTAKLVGTDMEKICHETAQLLTDASAYDAMSKAVNPYGDGKSSGRIVDVLRSL